jgi:hypothetical protein
VGVVLIWRYKNPLGIRGQVISGSWPSGGSTLGGEETLAIPDEPGAVDAGDVVKGVSLSELWIFFAESAQLHSAKTDETNFGGFGTIRMACFTVFTIFVYTRRS